MKTMSFKYLSSALVLTGLTTLLPMPATGATVVQQISAGVNHVCALAMPDQNFPFRRIYCWGSNNLGQLGNGSTTNSSLPVQVLGLAAEPRAVVAGYQQSCALLKDTTVQCWGANSFGQLGNGLTVASTVPVAVVGLSGVVSISTGTVHTCAVLNTGAVKCWGWNSNGQIGDGTATQRLAPTNVAGVSGALSVAVGSQHSCVLLNNGTMQCWGANADGQLGNGTTGASYTRVNVSGLTGVVRIATGQYHTCALNSVGGVKCWGNHAYGQLGNGMLGGNTKVSLPVDVIGLTSGVADLTASGSAGGSTCAILTTSLPQCWGFNSAGQLGSGDHINYATPVSVTGLSGAASTMTIGGSNACAALISGGVMCWGNNNVGQGGVGNTVTLNFPQYVAGF